MSRFLTQTAGSGDTEVEVKVALGVTEEMGMGRPPPGHGKERSTKAGPWEAPTFKGQTEQEEDRETWEKA